MKNKPKKISVIIPVYNEENYISACLDSILSNFTNDDSVEILIFDGGSTDKTKEILLSYQEAFPFIRVYQNRKRYQVYALNEGIKKAKGDIIFRCDAHAIYPPGYFATLLNYHEKNLADNIGTSWIVIPGDNSIEAKVIAKVFNSKFGVGPIPYRIISKRKIMYVDTVPFGSWKKDVFERYGLFDETFIRSQDFEHNIRILKKGGKILLLPWIKIKYFGRTSIKKVAKMCYQYGIGKALVFRKHKYIKNLSILFPFIYILFPFIFVPHTLSLCLGSFYIAKKEKLPYKLVLSAMCSIHFPYLYGFLKGLFINPKKIKFDTSR